MALLEGTRIVERFPNSSVPLLLWNRTFGISNTGFPLSSSRRHLSYDDRLEEGKLSELFCVVYNSCA